MRICKDCKSKKRESEFYSKSYTRCKSCHSAVVKANQKEKADYYNKYRNDYQKQNRERYRKWITRWKKNFEKRNGIPLSVHVKKLKDKRMEDPKYRAKMREKSALTRMKNYQQHLERSREYYRRNRERVIARVLAYQKLKRKEKK